jgi:hypothetical protein
MKFLINLILITTIFSCISKEQKRNNENVDFDASDRARRLKLDSMNYYELSNLGYNDNLNEPILNKGDYNFQILIKCKNRFFYKLLHVSGSQIKEKILDFTVQKNNCKLSYKKIKKIQVEGKETPIYYDEIKYINYRDTLIANFLNRRIYNLIEPIITLDKGGRFEIVKIDVEKNRTYFDIYNYLYENKEVKDFYNALMSRTKKDNCECLENLHWIISK